MDSNNGGNAQISIEDLFEEKYEAYLFFDIDLAYNMGFTRLAIETASGCDFENCEFAIHSAQTGEYFGSHTLGSQSEETLLVLRNLILNGNYAHGVALVDENLKWYIFQENPTTLGILGLSNGNLSRASKSTLKDNFVTCQQMREWPPSMVRSFEDFHGVGCHSRILVGFCK
jgi:hypothetical protein